uniref:uncharacterized protein LOC120340620 isoform X1 n=1 Tax=Styela clava TaxID=7725 RepID=UPI001939A268|nr:uncharacterized protein LOC120340620 isoform X1 [Styela clava]
MDNQNDIGSSSTHSDTHSTHLLMHSDNTSSTAEIHYSPEDVSYTSETVRNSLHVPDENHSGPDHQSLNEFEEIERLIKENTAVDTEDEENSAEEEQGKQHSHDLYGDSEFHPDTGYQTVEGFEYPQSPMPTNSPRLHHSRAESPAVSEEWPSRRSSRSAASNRAANSSLEKSVTDLDVTLDRFLTQPEEENVSDDEKLVATFGTTENLEDLLERQLKDMEDEENENSENEQTQTRTKPPTLASSSRDNINKQSNSRTETKPRQPIRPPRFRRAVDNRTTRSPAANRVKKAHQRSRVKSSLARSPSFPESSDGDLSVRSDVSRTELRQRLRREHKDKKKEKEVSTQLQTDYDELLTRYAEAENVIDQLRIGAKIDLFASIPTGGSGEGFNQVNSNPHQNPAQNVSDIHGSQRSSPRQKKISSVASGSSHAFDSLIESSLKLPSAASSEFLRVALEHQANDLKEQMESFKTLLDGGHVSDTEKRQVLRDLEEALRSLERDYMTAGNDHEAEKLRTMYSTAGQPNQSDEFDPNHKIEGEIFKLGRMFEGIKDDVYATTHSQTPLSSRKSFVSEGINSSSESSIDLDAGFNEQLRRYNKQPPAEDEYSHTTASSNILSSDDDIDGDNLLKYRRNNDDDDEDTISDISKSTVKDSDMPERFLRPPSANTSGSPSRSRIIETSDELSPVRSQQQSNSSNSGSPHGRPRSRLPRPVGSRSHSTPVVPKKRSSSKDAEVDSGFQGSERSAQSSIPSTKAQQQQQQKPRTETLPNYPKFSPKQQLTSTPINQTKPVIKQSRGGNTITKPPKPTTSSKSTAEKRSQHTDSPSTSHVIPPKPIRMVTSQQDNGNKATHLKEHPLTTQNQPSFHHQPNGPHDMFSPHKPIYVGTSGSVIAPTERGSIESEFEWVPREKSRPSSRRSITSSKDSTLGLLRGEIAKLRQEIAESRMSQPSFHHPSSKLHSKSEISESEYSSPLRRRGSDTKERTKRIFPQRNGSFKSQAGDDREKLRRARETRNVKSGGDTPIDRQAQNTDTSNMPTSGHWAYISSYPGPMVRPQTAYYYPTVVPATPVAPRMGSVYITTPPPMYTAAVSSPARIYVPAPSPIHYMHETIPYESVRGRSTSRRSSRRSSIVEHESDENDIPLRRSHLVSVKRSSSVPPLHQSYLDPQLSRSLLRAEKASDLVRSKSRAMYRSLRDSLNKSEQY